MIRDISHKTLGLSFALLVIGTVGGAAVVWKISDNHESVGFFKFATVAATVIFAIQIILFFYMKKRIFFQLIFLSGCGLSLVWFMFALFGPMLWVNIMSFELKSIIILTSIVLIYCNIAEAFRIFDRRWVGLEKDLLDKQLCRKGNFINWDKLIKSLNLSADFYIPGVPRNITAFFSLIILGFMVLGLNLRTAFPVFSVFSVGICSAFAISLLFQLIGFNLAQACKVRELEKFYGVEFTQET